MRTANLLVFGVAASLLFAACGGGGGSDHHSPKKPLVVNSTADLADPPAGTVTLRSALAAAKSGQPITFDPSLDGATIGLSIVGETHTKLLGEVMGIRDEPSGPVSYLVGYFERDYGRSALYARKDVVIDAGALPNGITIAWTGGDADPARVLAVYGDLTLIHVTVTGGRSFAEDISATDPDQPWTLARGAGLAVWGRATLRNVTVHDNHCRGDFDSSRDRGAFGGGVYADTVDIDGSVIGGNTVLGGGAAGGGVYSVTGADRRSTRKDPASLIRNSSITGNHISAVFAYGAGVYSDGGGIGNAKTLQLTNVTIARNLVDPPAGLPPFLLGIGYWRGGGVYMSNGSLRIESSTIVENETHGWPRTDSLDRPNLAGGIAATIGNAHAVEDLILAHSIVAGNTVHELGFGGPGVTYEHDIFTGSLLHFRSRGYNRIGVIDFRQMLVPVTAWGWRSICRRHYPKTGDEDGTDLADVLDLAGGVTTSGLVVSRGVDAGQPAVLSYRPRGSALDQVPAEKYRVEETLAQLFAEEGATDDFLSIVLRRIESHYGLPGFADQFTADFEAYLRSVDLDPDAPGSQPYVDPEGDPVYTVAQTHWYGPANTWPKEVVNHPWIEFWHHLDAALVLQSIPGMGPEVLGDDAWSALFSPGRLAENPAVTMDLFTRSAEVRLVSEDQMGTPRPAGDRGDIGAIERP